MARSVYIRKEQQSPSGAAVSTASAIRSCMRGGRNIIDRGPQRLAATHRKFDRAAAEEACGTASKAWGIWLFSRTIYTMKRCGCVSRVRDAHLGVRERERRSFRIREELYGFVWASVVCGRSCTWERWKIEFSLWENSSVREFSLKHSESRYIE